MARETVISYYADETIYQIVRRADGLAWNPVSETFVAKSEANWALIAQPLSEENIAAADNSDYVADFPEVPAATYLVEIYLQGEGGPVPTDGPPRWTTEVNWAGTSLLIVDPPPPDQATSIYHSYQEFISRWGLTNVRVASNLENKTTTVNQSTLQQSFDWAADEIKQFMRGGIYEVPLVFLDDDGTETETTPWVVKDWAMTLAFSRLYFARGAPTGKEGRSFSSKVRTERDAVYADMSLYKSGLKHLNAKVGTDVDPSPTTYSSGTCPRLWWFGDPDRNLTIIY